MIRDPMLADKVLGRHCFCWISGKEEGEYLMDQCGVINAIEMIPASSELIVIYHVIKSVIDTDVSFGGVTFHIMTCVNCSLQLLMAGTGRRDEIVADLHKGIEEE